MLPGPSERSLSINEEELEGSFGKWNAANKGPEELFKPEVLCFTHDVGFQQALGAYTELDGVAPEALGKGLRVGGYPGPGLCSDWEGRYRGYWTCKDRDSQSSSLFLFVSPPGV